MKKYCTFCVFKNFSFIFLKEIAGIYIEKEDFKPTENINVFVFKYNYYYSYSFRERYFLSEHRTDRTIDSILYQRINK